VTPQQLSQPLGSGAKVIEIPGVFDDCMKIVEELSEHYDLFLRNSKNCLRIMGQKTFSYEIAQQFDYTTNNLALVVPIGNAGNITAIMQGFLDFYHLGIIETLPKIIGVQSMHADPVYKWYKRGNYVPTKVKPSVAQAAMIGDPVSFPRINQLVKNYFREQFAAVQVSEQEIMESMLLTNREGHVVCTQGGESVAGLKKAVKEGLISKGDKVVVDSTSHQLKFSGFQQMFFDASFPDEYNITVRKDYINQPIALSPSAKEIAEYLGLKKIK
ncbi:pyridoxal-phosphate dependent enzyme, partial [Candidatus Woesearchaeota archaeon]|nr:pyridoxal-phosphate dependent enzyme [Candidatus Woesearchaeota archaeon]